MSENFRKIVQIVFELRTLMWGWQGCGTYASFFNNNDNNNDNNDLLENDGGTKNCIYKDW